MVGVCYRPPKQDEEADEISDKQLGEVSHFRAFVLTGDFTSLNVCWKYIHFRIFLSVLLFLVTNCSNHRHPLPIIKYEH